MSQEATFVKVCGLRTLQDVEVAVAAGADAVGFVVADGSPRHVSEAELHGLVDAVAARVRTVLVVKGVPIEEALGLCSRVGADLLQTHGYPAQDEARVVSAGVPLWSAKQPDAASGGLVGASGEEAWLVDSPQAGSGRPGTTRDSPRPTAVGSSPEASIPTTWWPRSPRCAPGASTYPAVSRPSEV
nr:hypothetical protein [Nocardioides alcanivorans]